MLTDDGEPELGGSRAVDDPVVERERDVADLRDSELALADDGSRRNSPDAEDRDLGVVDDRCLEEAGELARARDGEGRAAQLLRLERAGAGAFGQAGDFRGELVDRRRVTPADDGDDEPVTGLDRDAEVVPVEVDDLVAFEPRVQLGELLQGLRTRLQHRRQQELEVELAEVAFLHPRHRRHLAVGAGHVLGNQPPNPPQRLPASLRARSRCLSLRRGRATHVRFGHSSLRAGPFERVEVDAELLGKPAHERRRADTSLRATAGGLSPGHWPKWTPAVEK